jgi:hypothetical protein
MSCVSRSEVETAEAEPVETRPAANPSVSSARDQKGFFMASESIRSTVGTHGGDAPVRVSIGRQALRREVNERISEAGARRLEAFCECGLAGCSDRLTVDREGYEEVRRFPTRFLVKQGHASEQDRLVAEHDGFVVVEKFGASGLAAVRFDRRRRRLTVED